MRGHSHQQELMKVALAEARKGKGRTYPNPAVGAVIARGRRIVGTGFHRRWGMPHAEVEAIRSAGSLCRGSDLYVTLEPCCHYGKTPPCTEAIVAAGIGRVFVAARDPNPVVRGKGIKRLRKAGIKVDVGLEARAARRLNETYFTFMKHRRPFVTLKIAQTLDGKIATRDGRSKWITSAGARKLARQLRGEAQAIMVGVNTVKKDDPMLLPQPARKAFYRCVLDSDLSIPKRCKLIATALRHRTVVYCSRPTHSRMEALTKLGVLVRQVDVRGAGLVDLAGVMEDLASRGVMHLWVEGGSAVFTSFLKEGLVDRVLAFVAPRIMGDRCGLGSFANLDVKYVNKCYGFTIDEVSTVGEDGLLVLYPRRR